MTAIWQEIERKLAARTPFLYLQSAEEGRVRAQLAAMGERLGLPLVTYSAFAGFHPALDGRIRVAPEEALAAIDTAAAPGLYLLFDFHHALGMPIVQRQLKDLSAAFAARRQSVLIVAARVVLPVEIDTYLPVLTLPLPEAEELAHLYRALAKHMGSDDGEAAAVGRAAAGLTSQQAERVFRRLLLDPTRQRENDVAVIVAEKRLQIEAGGVLRVQASDVALADVGGLSALKEWFGQRGEAFGAAAANLPEPKGLLLLGVQGCGKSLAAKAVAAAWRLPLVAMDFGAIFAGHESPEQTMRLAEQRLEAMAPVVLWIDEIEKAFAGARESMGDVSGQRVFGQFLTWLQEKRRPVFVIATANNIDQLPPELLRKGRFDDIFFVDLPDSHERAAILAIHLRRHGHEPTDFALDELAQATTRNFTGAELEHVVNDALYRAFAEGVPLASRHLDAAATALVPLYNTYEEDIKRLREWAKSRARRASADNTLSDFFEKA